jgi:hypothetical protein
MKADDMAQRNAPRPGRPLQLIDLDLDARIARAEQAVIERDERIRQRSALIFHRVQHGVVRHAGLGVAAAAGGALLAWLLGRTDPGSRGPDPWSDTARGAGFSLAGLLPLVWPFMPRKVRRHVSPGTASTFLAVVMPLVTWALGRRRRATPPEP